MDAENPPIFRFKLNCTVVFPGQGDIGFVMFLDSPRLPVIGESIIVFGDDDSHYLRITSLAFPSQHEGEYHVTLDAAGTITRTLLLQELNQDLVYNQLIGKAV